MGGYTAEIEALEEEVERWKQAATDEAAAGAAVMEDLERCQYEVQFNWVNYMLMRFMTLVASLQDYKPHFLLVRVLISNVVFNNYAPQS